MRSTLSTWWRWLRRRWWLILLILVVLFGAGWWYLQKQKQQPTEKTVQLQRQDLRRTLDLSGRIDAYERASLRFAGAGKVNYLGVKEGDAVKKGQILARLDARSAQKTLEQKLNLYQDERWSYENTVDSRENRTLSEAERRTADQDQFALQRTVQNVELQSLVIEDTALKSPFAGVVVSVPIKTTGVVIAATDAFEVVNPDTLYFRVLVDEVDIDLVKVGQMAEVVLDAYPDMPLSAYVDQIAYQSTETTSGTVFPVRLKFVVPASLDTQRIGMNGEAAILLEEKQAALVLPSEVLSVRNGEHFVKVRGSAKEPEERKVTIGIETDDWTEILDGIGENDRVVEP